MLELLLKICKNSLPLINYYQFKLSALDIIYIIFHLSLFDDTIFIWYHTNKYQNWTINWFIFYIHICFIKYVDTSATGIYMQWKLTSSRTYSLSHHIKFYSDISLNYKKMIIYVMLVSATAIHNFLKYIVVLFL